MVNMHKKKQQLVFNVFEIIIVQRCIMNNNRYYTSVSGGTQETCAL